jgi:hypothetical protein
LPSKKIENAASNPEVVVREIKTPSNGSWYAVINTSMKDAVNVRICLKQANLIDYLTGRSIKTAVPVSLYPGQVLVWYSKQ